MVVDLASERDRRTIEKWRDFGYEIVRSADGWRWRSLATGRVSQEPPFETLDDCVTELMEYAGGWPA